MIDVTRINNTRFVLNCDLIQTVEETPDTVITLTTGAKYVVKESCEEISSLLDDVSQNEYNEKEGAEKWVKLFPSRFPTVKTREEIGRAHV